MFNNIAPMVDIDRRIEDLQRLKNSYQNIPQQQPINIYNNTNAPNSLFEAHILNKNEKVDEILVKNKTMFLDLFKGKLTIKETNGETKEYDVILPKTKEQIKIEELERKLSFYEQQFEQQYDNANNEIKQSNDDDNEQHEPSTKATCRGILKRTK